MALVLVCLFLMTDGDECLSRDLLAICVSSGETSVPILCPFLNGHLPFNVEL